MPEKKRIRFIVNPFSGVSNKNNLKELLSKHLDHSKYDYDYHLTKAPKHATELAKEAVSRGYYMAVAVGGDGTVNEVAAALKDSKTLLGIIPGGSGNGFAMFIGLGRKVIKAIQHLNTGMALEIDSCSMNGEFYINIAGIGFDAKIAFEIKQSSKRGFWLYFKTVIKEAFKFEANEYQIELDGRKIKASYTVIAVANAAMYGYNFTIAPEAELRDGLYDVVLLKKASIFRYLLSSWRLINNSLHKSRLVETIKAKNVSITPKHQDYHHLDGEGYLSPEKLDFELYPKSLKVLFPLTNKLK